MNPNGQTEHNSNRHMTFPNEAGQIYCRAMHCVRSTQWCYCKDCVLFGGYIEEGGKIEGVDCIYEEAPFLCAANDKLDENAASEGTENEMDMTPKERYDMVETLIRENKTGSFPAYPSDSAICMNAIRFAAEAHKGAVRKGNKLPYIIHHDRM